MVLCFHCSANEPFFLQEGFMEEHGRLTSSSWAFTEAFSLQPQPIYNLLCYRLLRVGPDPRGILTQSGQDRPPTTGGFSCHHWRGPLHYPGTTLVLPYSLYSTAKKSQDKVDRMALEARKKRSQVGWIPYWQGIPWFWNWEGKSKVGVSSFWKNIVSFILLGVSITKDDEFVNLRKGRDRKAVCFLETEFSTLL